MSKRISIIMVTAAVCFNAASAGLLHCAQTAEEADYNVCVKAFKSGSFELAEGRVESFLRNYPHTAYLYDAHLLLARALYHQNDMIRAIYELDMILNASGGTKIEDEAAYWYGEIQYKSGDYKKALEYYQKIIDGYPSSRYLDYAYYSKAWCYYKLGFMESAIDSFKELVARYQFDKFAMEGQFMIGECRYALGDYDKALAETSSFIQKFPISEKVSDSYYLNGEALFGKKRFGDSIEPFRRALSISPSAKWARLASYRIAQSYFLLGDNENSMKEFMKCDNGSGDELISGASSLGIARNYKAMGRAEDALKVCDDIIVRFPKSDAAGAAYYMKVQALYAEMRYQDAENLLKAAIPASAENEYLYDLHYEMGCVYSAQRRESEARDEFMRVVEGSKDAGLVSSALCKVGDGYFYRKEYKSAFENYDAVLDKYPDGFMADYAQYQIGNISLLSGKIDQSILAYQSLMANFPDSQLKSEVASSLAIAYFKNRDFERAAAEFDRLIKASSPEAIAGQFKFYLAASLYNIVRYADALSIYRQLIEGSPEGAFSVMARYQLGWCYYNMRKESEALNEFKSFIKAYPQSVLSADAKYWLGEHYRSKGEYAKAREQFVSVLSGSPDSDIAGESMYQIAMAYDDEAQPDKAVKSLEELAFKLPGTSYERRAYRKMAKIKKKAGYFDEAVNYYRKAITEENSDQNAQIQYEIAESLEEKGAIQEAGMQYLEVPRLYSKGTFWSVRAELKAAGLFERMGSLDKAKALYGKLSLMDLEESGFARSKLTSLSRKAEKKK